MQTFTEHKQTANVKWVDNVMTSSSILQQSIEFVSIVEIITWKPSKQLEAELNLRLIKFCRESTSVSKIQKFLACLRFKALLCLITWWDRLSQFESVSSSLQKYLDGCSVQKSFGRSLSWLSSGGCWRVNLEGWIRWPYFLYPFQRTLGRYSIVLNHTCAHTFSVCYNADTILIILI